MGSAHVRRLRVLNAQPNPTYETFKKAIEHPDPAICANTMLCLIRLTTYLLSGQIQAQELEFLRNGGLRERMHKARKRARYE